MCGIVGVLSHTGSVVEHLGALPALIDLMARRGPDDVGTWTDSVAAALGFRRLAVIDPTPTGHQPMITGDGRSVLVFNGEVYNFRELRAELEAKGARFRSHTDTEVVLQALATWGTDALARFNGMFALAWYDTVSRMLVLVRDPLGIKPLYYLDHPKALVFGSQYDQLLRHPLCDRSEIRPDVLSLYLRLGYVPSPYGVVAGTAQLEAGHYLVTRPGWAPRIRRYRHLPESAAENRLLVGDAAVEATAESVERAVTRQMVSDVPTGAFLSGGVDSPLVVANMRRAAAEPIPVFTIGCTDPTLDESAAAARYARDIGAEHHLRTFEVGDALALLDDMAVAYSEPFADPSALPTMLVSSVARERVKVVLSGDGGDEVFWGYPRFRKVLKARPWFSAPRPARWLGYTAGKVWPAYRPPKGVTFPTLGDWYLDSHSGMRRTDLESLCPPAVAAPPDFSLYELPSAPDAVGLAQWLRANELRGHLEAVLAKVDRASMFYGLEVRVPLLDWEVVEGAARLSPAACMDLDRSVGKVVLRGALARHVAAAAIPIQKRGFDVPIASWLRRELAPRVHDLLVTRDPFPTGLFDRQTLAEYVRSPTARPQALWTLFTLQLWADAHLRQPPVPVVSTTKGAPL